MTGERITGGYSTHDAEKPELCKRGVERCGPWRVVECGGIAGEDRDIEECQKCGRQANVRCKFDEEYS